VKGNFKTIVMLPKYVDIMEWVAVNSEFISLRVNLTTYVIKVFDFYTNLNEFYGVIAECCTQRNCPTMSAGSAYVYLPRSQYVVLLFWLIGFA
jgi:MOB kinase activator 1